MRTIFRSVSGLAIAVTLAGAMPVAAQPARTRRALTLPATGGFAGGGSFEGRITINRFERRGNHIVAIGFVTGVLSREGASLGTAVAGEVVWPVTIEAGGISAASAPRTSGERGRIIRLSWPPDRPAGSKVVPVQAESCAVVDIALGPIAVNLLGVQVSLDPVALSLSGAAGTPLGDLVCAVSDLLGNVAALVNVLNSLLGLLLGLLGGLGGGLGG